ncbi:hypothetical protein NP493_1843g00020 [Ridgeia piscesae]|uniref:Uncharacterized protein n=1 Tax=Ridgeia piscesae TaxID=27915 RepID=A0AAD9JR50_RIDPI|nr:hypothetical protein NP493_1843g00020 [Ridgeia piscesae]
MPVRLSCIAEHKTSNHATLTAWHTAADQIFYSLGVAFGGLESMAGDNRFKTTSISVSGRSEVDRSRGSVSQYGEVHAGSGIQWSVDVCAYGTRGMMVQTQAGHSSEGPRASQRSNGHAQGEQVVLCGASGGVAVAGQVVAWQGSAWSSAVRVRLWQVSSSTARHKVSWQLVSSRNAEAC